jgi:Tannase and feruloyl esterase
MRLDRLLVAIARILAFGIAALVAATVQAQIGQFENWKEAPKGRAPKAACDHLRALTSYDFSIDNAVVIPAEGEMPEFCQVQGQITPEVRFEVALPKDWNGRLYMFGNGGFAGESLAAGSRVTIRNAAIRRGLRRLRPTPATTRRGSRSRRLPPTLRS